MTTCFHCGADIHPDQAVCQACGYIVDQIARTAPPASAPSGHQVELISKLWDTVEVTGSEVPVDEAMEIDSSAPPLPPGGIEFSVDGISVVATDDAAPETQDAAAETAEAAKDTPPAAIDPWDHLRPKGELPKRARWVSLSARTVQTLAAATALATVAAGAAHFYLNTKLQAAGRGDVSTPSIADVKRVTDASLLVVAGMIVLTILSFVWWRWRVRRTGIRSGKAGAVALLALVAGGALVATFHTLRETGTADAIATNTLIILGLGLLVAASFIVAATTGGLDHRAHQ